ncbi:ABC-ATPase domain-containing protein [Spirochaeta isovalerica]|uniref:Putative ABC-class ATPase n=1 Tax=Spirochaeta isovalerica TaxID=150 RepID=A0A841RCZ8_9SPIO|nr:ABC-ATPase domain-containing protein [Spirochaeta isovalerica]MBB6480870.1 putative ABC-class ATPase [Spirochaeta isovalerica]
MKNNDSIRSFLAGINGRDYGAYQSLIGEYDFGDFRLIIERIPKDPYAPSFTGLYRAVFNKSYTYIPPGLGENPLRVTAFGDFMIRRFFRESEAYSFIRGTGNSGLITVDKPGQAILERNSFLVRDDTLELRFFVGLPAEGRLINAKLAELMILEEVPRIMKKAFFRENIEPEACLNHLNTALRSEFLRSSLEEKNLVAFIADGSILPRTGGDSDEPVESRCAVPFSSPESLAENISLPDGTAVRGMAVPRGITLITGGGYHGKSTLLKALAAGVYNHIPGDGREMAVSLRSALKIRSYSGRPVAKVNISPFIDHLPGGIRTDAFSTQNASGSTSQAAALMEGLEAGAEVLLMDEDTCATNFMIRDRLMQELVAKEDEPITPFIDRVDQLYQDNGVSTILVLGGSGDYFSHSTTVIQMKDYLPLDVTGRAGELVRTFPSPRRMEGNDTHITPTMRIPLAGSVDPLNHYGKKSVFVREVRRINMGRTVIDLTDLEQLEELSQTKAITEAILFLKDKLNGEKTIQELLAVVEKQIERAGLDGLSSLLSGNLAGFRMIELAGAINRLRTLKIQ